MVERGGHRRGGAARSVALPALLVLASLSSAAAQGVRTPESIVAGVQRARDEVTDAHLRAIKALATDAPEDALIDVVWLWTEAGSQPSGPMPMDRFFRDTMLAGTTRRLVAKSPAARTVLEGHRQSLQDEVFGDDPDPHVLADWFTLSSILGEEEELLAWHDVWEARTGAHPRLIGSARPTLMRVLVEHARFAEAGKMAVVFENSGFPDGLWTLGAPGDAETGAPDDNRPSNPYTTLRKDVSRVRAGELHGLLLAARRDAEAWRVAEEFLESYDDATSRAVLVEAAMDMGVLHFRHGHLVFQAEARVASEAERIESVPPRRRHAAGPPDLTALRVALTEDDIRIEDELELPRLPRVAR